MEAQEASFIVQCLGQIDSGSFSSDYLYCRYGFSFGNDWDIIAGLDNGLSQTACRNALSSDSKVVWNFPVDATFKSTNVHGWPRLALSVYGIDYFGRDIVYGYGSALVPLVAGNHHLQVCYALLCPLCAPCVSPVPAVCCCVLEVMCCQDMGLLRSCGPHGKDVWGCVSGASAGPAAAPAPRTPCPASASVPAPSTLPTLSIHFPDFPCL